MTSSISASKSAQHNCCRRMLTTSSNFWRVHFKLQAAQCARIPETQFRTICFDNGRTHRSECRMCPELVVNLMKACSLLKFHLAVAAIERYLPSRLAMSIYSNAYWKRQFCGWTIASSKIGLETSLSLACWLVICVYAERLALN